MKDTGNSGTPQEKPSKGFLPSTHLLGLHLAPGVHNAGLPAAVPQQVLPQVATRLFKALTRGTRTTLQPQKAANPPCKGERHLSGSRVLC